MPSHELDDATASSEGVRMESIRERLAVAPERLRRRLDPASLPFMTTAEVEPLNGTIGQPRALDAIEFGLDVQNHGYNLYVAGVPGSGRETTVRDYLGRYARTRPTPPDWVYVHNFDEADRPNAIPLPAGRGVQFAREMDEFLATARQEIPRAFESEDYERRRRDALAELGQQREELFRQMNEFAANRGFVLEATPTGILSIPVVQGRPLSSEEFERLPAEVQQEIRNRDAEIQEHVSRALRQVRQLEKEAAERVRKLDRDVVSFVVGPMLDDMRDRYQDCPEVVTYLENVRNDLPEHLDMFRQSPQPAVPLPIPQPAQAQPDLNRYRVNVLIDNSDLEGAPVVIERNPSYYNLIGRIDYRATFGAMVTDFRQIRPGALHRANGGFLVLHVVEVLREPFAWDALKRALVTRSIQIENLGEQYSAVPMARLRPEPIPLSVKVVLIGPLEVYHVLYRVDEDFQELFKVRADFSPDMDWVDDHVQNYAAFISRRVREWGLRHFDRGAVARVVEYGARQREHQGKLSARLLDIANIVSEASYWAEKAGHEFVQADDVVQAIRKRRYRSNLVEERIRELLTDGTIMIDVDGQAVARVNGLAVLSFGDYAFGKPSRVTARVSAGRGSIVSIEREIELSGPIHSKGVMILSGYLRGHYGQHVPLAITATLTFEQSYEGVDGDSASSTELYALLSALSGLPLEQGIAVTGSVNQFGEVQAVGGVNQKIEGFYAVCKAKGLTGRQGVIIPAANVKNLMLDDEVVEAVRAGRFHVWAVHTVDEGIEILTGVPAGERGPDGQYPEGTVHRLVEDRLRRYADEVRAFAAPDGAAGAAQVASGEGSQ